MATTQVPEAVKAGYYDEWGDYIAYATPPEHVKLSKEETSYRDASEEERTARTRCYDCRFYGWGTCHLVEGTIEADDVCDLHKPSVQTVPEPLVSMYSATGPAGSYALFQPFAYAAEGEAGEASPVPPEWFDYYPAPGRFYHDLYGEIVITPDGNREMVDNFAAKVFQDRLPIDCEHDLESSGAVGWIVEMRVGDRGQVEARAEWNERGEDLLTGDRFRYFSPHLWPTWREPVNQTEYHHVAIGGAICVRPFFNQDHLTPLVATADGGLDVIERAERPLAASSGTSPERRSVSVIRLTPVALTRQTQEEVPVMGTSTESTTAAPGTTPAPAVTPAPQFTAANAEAFNAFMAAGGPEAFKRLQTQATEQAEEIGRLRKDARRERFTAMVLGREGQDEGAPWAGAVEHNVTMLEHLADTSEGGEESAIFKAHLEVQRAAAQAAASSAAFSEIGSSRRPALGQTAVQRRDAKIEEFTATGLTYEAAASKVAQEYPDLYDAAAEEVSERV